MLNKEQKNTIIFDLKCTYRDIVELYTDVLHHIVVKTDSKLVHSPVMWVDVDRGIIKGDAKIVAKDIKQLGYAYHGTNVDKNLRKITDYSDKLTKKQCADTSNSLRVVAQYVLNH